MQFPFWWALCFPSQPCCSLRVPQSHMHHCTLPIALREQVNHTTNSCAPRILLKRNNLDSEKTRTTTHNSRTTRTGRENRVDLVLQCCKWDHKSPAPRMQMVDSGASKPRYTSGYWLFIGESLFDRQIKLEVTRPGKCSTRKSDLWRSTTQECTIHLWNWCRLHTENYKGGVDFLIFTI